MYVVGLLALFGLARVGKNFLEKKGEEMLKVDIATEQPICHAVDSLSGVCLNSAPVHPANGGAGQQVVGVMIENAPEVRPQSGLTQASLIFETIAEFPYTRFLVFYSSPENLPEKIGPVRSARKYFVEWANELDAVFTHCGGSPDALDFIKSSGAKDLNEFYNQQNFYRSWTQSAPHNVFTKQSMLVDALKVKGWSVDKIDFDLWKFKDDALLDARPETQEIKIDFNNAAFFVNWKYDRQLNVYNRSQGGADTGLSAKNVAVMYVESKVVDNAGRRQMSIVGSGDAVVFLDGKAIKGKWQKLTESARTKFFDELGGEINFNRGATWVEVVPSDMPLIKY
jgi:hypothetical protein